jgi:hypothetical protein
MDMEKNIIWYYQKKVLYLTNIKFKTKKYEQSKSYTIYPKV